jgi:hypothetical protein
MVGIVIATVVVMQLAPVVVAVFVVVVLEHIVSVAVVMVGIVTVTVVLVQLAPVGLAVFDQENARMNNMFLHTDLSNNNLKVLVSIAQDYVA